jgi:predicted PurR-regulated permease PerM
MHELLIFFSTLGGLMFFGAMGFILGPILAALFVHRVGNIRHDVPQRAR